MKKPKEKDAGEVGHMRVAGGGAKALFGAPNTKNQAFEIEGKIEFRMKSVPAGEKSPRGVVFEGNKKAKKNQD